MFFSYGWMSSLFAPNKNASFFAFCTSPSYVFSPKNLLSAYAPSGSQKAPRNFAEGSQKAPRKIPRGLPEGFQQVPEGSQKAPRRSSKVPRRFPKASQTIPQGSQNGYQKAPRTSQRLPDAPRRLPEKYPKRSKKLPETLILRHFYTPLHQASFYNEQTAILGCNIGTARAGL
jgi:hypothetical protein